MASGSGSRFGLIMVLALFGFVLAVGMIQERLREEASPRRRAELVGLIEQRRATIHDLARDVHRVAQRVADVQRQTGAGSERVAALLADIDRLEARAGTAALEGPGLIVQLSDSGRDPATLEDVSDFRIQDVDLQLVVNALWRAGAEAVGVNGLRIASTTAIRKAGAAILINYRAVSSPYRVSAIGDPASLERALLEAEIARQFDVWQDVYGLGFTVERRDRLAVPGLAAIPELRWAEPEAP